MKLTYYGHATFLLESGATSILLDPFNEKVGYPFPDVRPTAVTVSHEHFDHSHVQVAKGAPKVIRGLREGGNDWAAVKENVGPVRISAVPTFHDASNGSERGRNTMFVFEAEGLRVVHAGDLGHPLSAEQARAVGRVDVLMIPVGGYYTIGPKEADAVIGQLHPRVVIPMHYKTDVNKDWPIGTVDEFLHGKQRVQRQERSVTITAAALPKDLEVWVLRHA